MKNRNRHVWPMGCIAICTVLGLRLDAKQIDKFCRKHSLYNGKGTLNTSYGSYLLHEACHKEGAVVPKRLNSFHSEQSAGIIRAGPNITCRSENEVASEVEAWIE